MQIAYPALLSASQCLGHTRSPILAGEPFQPRNLDHPACIARPAADQRSHSLRSLIFSLIGKMLSEVASQQTVDTDVYAVRLDLIGGVGSFSFFLRCSPSLDELRTTIKRGKWALPVRPHSDISCHRMRC